MYNAISEIQCGISIQWFIHSTTPSILSKNKIKAIRNPTGTKDEIIILSMSDIDLSYGANPYKIVNPAVGNTTNHTGIRITNHDSSICLSSF